jgi:hypothetical protein
LNCSTLDMKPIFYPKTSVTDSTILHRVKSQVYGLIYTSAETWNHAKNMT